MEIHQLGQKEIDSLVNAMSLQNGNCLLTGSGGEGGIRTPGRFNPSTVFKTAAFDRSATSP